MKGIFIGMDTKELEVIDGFAWDSNRIEGILDEHSWFDMNKMLLTFVKYDTLSLDLVIDFAKQLKGDLRVLPGMDVKIGDYMPPLGGAYIKNDLERILLFAMQLKSPFTVHKTFESLHPFTDGNGRTGRAIWLWMMLKMRKSVQLGFLHTWYYQSLRR